MSNTPTEPEMARKRVLAIDVGGSHVKALATGATEHVKFDSGPLMTPADMVEGVRGATASWTYDVISIGFPAPVVRGRILREPVNLAPGWLDFDFHAAFGKPTRVVNDALMQALGSYAGGRMLFLGLGTGLGTAMIADDIPIPFELAHLPYRKRTFEGYLGVAGLERSGVAKWEKRVHRVAGRLRAALICEYVVYGGGNAKKLTALPPDSRLGDNENAFAGGFRLWDAPADRLPAPDLSAAILHA